MNKTHKIDAGVIGAAAGSALSAARGITMRLANLMTECGIDPAADKTGENDTAELWTAYSAGYYAEYAKRYGDMPVATAIAGNNIKLVPNATATDRVELNKARNACGSLWKAALVQAFGKVQKGANQKSDADKGATESGETGETGATVKKLDRETCAAFLANGDMPTAELLLWATGPGLVALRKWAGKAMPQPK